MDKKERTTTKTEVTPSSASLYYVYSCDKQLGKEQLLELKPEQAPHLFNYLFGKEQKQLTAS